MMGAQKQALFSGFFICICQFFVKTNMKDAPTALIMMLTQAEDMIPAHDHLSDSTGNVFVSNGKMYLFQIVKYIYLR